MPQAQQQTFTSVQPLPQSFGDVTPIDSGTGSNSNGLSTPADWDALKDKYELPHSVDLSKTFIDNYGRMSKEDFNKIDIEKFSKAWQEANPQAPTPTSFLGRSWDEAKKIVKGLTTESGGALFGNPMESTNVAGTQPFTNPLPAIQSRLSEAKEHPAAAAGAATTDIAAAVLPFVAGEAFSSGSGAIRSGWRKVGNPFGLASTGEELLTQGISPRTSLTKFAPSLERAAGDLKAFDAQSPIKNVHDLNDAIPEIKQKIWNEEVEPALQRQATKPVEMKPVANAVRSQISDEMRTFDEANAEKLEKLADKLEVAKDVKGANGLLKYINGQLESYFQKFPTARRANLMNNPETAGWEAARSELRNQFLTTLEDAGEAGVRDARLRYGAFDTLQDAVERRVNVADRAKPMSLGRIVGLAGAAPTGGLSLVAGELSNYLNKPDVLIRRGIAKLPEPIRTTPFAPATATNPLASNTGNLSEMTGTR